MHGVMLLMYGVMLLMYGTTMYAFIWRRLLLPRLKKAYNVIYLLALGFFDMLLDTPPLRPICLT